MKADEILKKKWRIDDKNESDIYGLSIGLSIVTVGDGGGEFMPHTIIVEGGNCEGYAVGVLDQQVAEHIVRLHNESLDEGDGFTSLELEKILEHLDSWPYGKEYDLAVKVIAELRKLREEQNHV